MGRRKKQRGQTRRNNRSSSTPSNTTQSPRPIPNISSMPGATDALDIATKCMRGGIQIQMVGGENGVGWVYSYNHGNGRPEYYVADVPAAKAASVANTINFLADIENVGHRHSIRGPNNMFFWINCVEGEAKERLLCEKCLFMNNFSRGAPIYELRPWFECSVTDSWWGSRPPAPNHQETIVDHILFTWENQKVFKLEVLREGSEMGTDFAWAMRTLFHDVDEIGLENVLFPRLKSVDLTLALKHVDDWKVDWDKSLNEEQIQFVKEHRKYFRRIARVMFRAKPICDYCGALEGLMFCAGCKSTHYCSRECQVADRKSHKDLCKQFKCMRNNDLPPIPEMERRFES